MIQTLFARSYAGLTLLALLATTATVRMDGQCLPPPRAVVAFDTLDYVSAPDINGVRLLVGKMSADRLAQIGAGIQNLPLPAFVDQKFCGVLDIAPGVRAEVYVPTAYERIGDYSASGPILFDPATRYTLGNGTEVMTPFPGSIVPASRQQPGGIFAWRLASLWPSAPGVLPPSPGAGSGAAQTFTFQFTAARKYSDLGVVNILVNFWLDGAQSCYLAYSRPANTLYLINDAGDGYAGSLPLNGTGLLANSQCLINGAGTSASGIGNTLTLALNMTFPALYAGTRIMYVAARDALENNSGWQRVGVWQVPGATQTTTTAVAGMNPARGAGIGKTFTFTFTDTKGASDLGVMNILVNDWLDGRHACYLAYARGNNTLYLMNDNGDALLPGLALNGSGSLSNSQCAVNGVGSSATPSGNTLTLTLNMTFGAGFAGNRVFYLAARDVNELNNTGWQALGSWTVQ